MPETQVLSEDGALRLVRQSFLQAGHDSYTKPPAQNPDLYESLTNWLPSNDGPLRKRWGMSRFDSGAAVSMKARVISEWRNDSGTKIRLVLSGAEGATRKVKTCDATGTVQNTGIWTVASTTDDPRAAMSRDYAHFANGTTNDLVKYDGNDTSGSGVTTWGLPTPATAPNVAASGSGSMTIQSFRDYCVAFQNTTTSEISDIGPFVRVEAFADKAQVDLTSVVTGAATIGGVNTGINQRLVLATSDGGARTKLYRVGVVADNTTTTFTDNVLEATLLTNDVYAEIDQTDGLQHGILGNARPPAGRYPIKHRGRIFLVVDRKLRFSKNTEEISTGSTWEIGGRWESAWPPEYEMDIPASANDPVGLISDEAFLYVLSKNGPLRLSGDGPLTFRPLEQIFKYIGVQSQDAIDVVYRKGAPSGVMWVTPNPWIVFSNMNTYDNLTWPLKDEMDDIPVANLGNVRVRYGNYEGYSLALVAVPQTGSTIPTKLLIYNLDTGKPAVWTLPATQEITALHFWVNPSTNLPQILWSVDDEKMYRFDVAKNQDLTSSDVVASFTSTGQSTWQDFGSPHIRKSLRQMEITGQTANITVSVDGATIASEFDTPTSIVSGVSVVTSQLGDAKVNLAGKYTKDRYYRFTFSIAANVAATTAAIRSYQVEAVPLHTM